MTNLTIPGLLDDTTAPTPEQDAAVRALLTRTGNLDLAPILGVDR